MKKSSRNIMIIIVLLSLIIGGIGYLLTPSTKITVDENRDIVKIEELLENSFEGDSDVLNNPLRIKGKLYITDEELSNILYTIAMNYDIEELKTVYVDVIENKINIAIPYKILMINSQIELNIQPSVVNQDLHLTLSDFKLGKLNIRDKVIVNQLEKYKEEITFEIDGNSIIIDEEKFSPITLENMSIQNNNVIIEVDVRASNILRFIGEYGLR